MKKLISVSLLLSLMLGLSACGAASSSIASPEAQTTAAAVEANAVPEPEEATEPAVDKLDEMIARMSLEEKVGQMFFAHCPDENAAETAAEYHLGGYVLFGRDFENLTADEVRANIQSYQDASKVPMLIGVDEEGGEVNRVSLYLRDTPFLSPKEYYADGGWEAVTAAETEKADLLLSLGINVNLAPVCDITTDSSQFMYLRSFSENADEVSEFASRTVSIYKEKKLGSTLKHFPGYGDNVDTHTGIARDTRSYSEFLSKDFKPFEAGVKAGADCVLVSHNIMECIDDEQPASLSDKVHQTLRDTLQFKGVIVTDDLIMEAITDYTGADTAAVAAVKAGNDMLCCSDLENQYPAVVEAVRNQEIPMPQIDRSVRRVLQWKQSLNLI